MAVTDRPRSSTTRRWGETGYEYDAAGRLISRENARGHAETYNYAAAGGLIELIDPLSNIVLRQY
jgi:YD repeat-containing protein